MDKQHIPEDLIKRYLDGTATDEEKALVESWHLQDFLKSDTAPDEEEITQVHAQMRQVLSRHAAPPKKLNPWYRYAAAACLLFMLGFTGYLLLHKPSTQQLAQNQVQDVKPGGNKAILTLANGQKISLTDARNGNIAQQSGAQINKTNNGQVVYSTVKNADQDAVPTYNMLATPRGGQYRLTLADGTVAYLDAASSIKYPVAFNGAERKVEITGQVYFEVVHNAGKPFRVAVKGQVIEDIGTHFNINAYDDEPVIKTTLIEGSVKVSATNQTALLKPGQQAITSANGKIKVINTDTEEAIAWKNGYFLFNDEPLESVMRKVSRWYDVDIEYPQGQKINEVYGGSADRYANVSQVLKVLEVTGDVRFKVEGKKILVLKK